MKQNLITDVVQAMLPFLNNAQTERLQEVLQQYFRHHSRELRPHHNPIRKPAINILHNPIDFHEQIRVFGVFGVNCILLYAPCKSMGINTIKASLIVHFRIYRKFKIVYSPNMRTRKAIN